ncbi:MAG: hypothetical protein ACXVLQ_17350, partial [Bacteriovorax sp.]
MVPQAYNSSERRQLKADQNFSVVGIFDTKYSTGSAVDKLREEGFKKEDITIVIPKAQTEPLEVEKKGRSSKSKGSTARAVAKNGAVIGAALGGVVGAGVFFGPFFAAGAILASIVGAGLGGLFGDIMGTLF